MPRNGAGEDHLTGAAIGLGEGVGDRSCVAQQVPPGEVTGLGGRGGLPQHIVREGIGWPVEHQCIPNLRRHGGEAGLTERDDPVDGDGRGGRRCAAREEEGEQEGEGGGTDLHGVCVCVCGGGGGGVLYILVGGGEEGVFGLWSFGVSNLERLGRGGDLLNDLRCPAVWLGCILCIIL